MRQQSGLWGGSRRRLCCGPIPPQLAESSRSSRRLVPWEMLPHPTQPHPLPRRSTGISLYYQMAEESLKGFTKDRQGNDFLVNLIDSPGGWAHAAPPPRPRALPFPPSLPALAPALFGAPRMPQPSVHRRACCPVLGPACLPARRPRRLLL